MPQYAVPTDQFFWKKHKYITVWTIWFFLFSPPSDFLSSVVVIYLPHFRKVEGLRPPLCITKIDFLSNIWK